MLQSIIEEQIPAASLQTTFLDNLRSCSSSSSSVLDSINLQLVLNGGRKFAWPLWFSLVQITHCTNSAMDLFEDSATAMRLRP